MNDLERRLKDMLDADASKAPTVQGAPERLRPKVRRRQLGTALVGSLTALALVAVSIAGLRALDRTMPNEPTPADDPWAGYQVFERTATLGPFTISSPSDWYLVNPAPDPMCSAGFDCAFRDMLQLSNFDPGLQRPACGAPVPDGGAVLSIRIDLTRSEQASADPEFPIALDAGAPPMQGPCGSGRYMRFGHEGTSYLAWVGTADDVADNDLRTLFGAFERMRIPRSDAVVDGPTSAAYVIAGGENAAGAWRLDARPSLPGAGSVNVELALLGADGGQLVEGFGVPSVPIEQAGGDPTFGAVTKEARAVELRTDGVAEPARIVPVPPSLGADFDLFFGPHEGDVPAQAVAIDGQGRALGTPYAVPTVAVTDLGDHVIQRFGVFGQTWELSASRSGEGCSLLRLDGSGASGGTCKVSLASSDDHAFTFGTLPDGATTAHVVTADGRELPCVVLTPGPSGRRYFVVPLEGPGPGELRMLRNDGTVLRTYDLRWRDGLAVGPPT